MSKKMLKFVAMINPKYLILLIVCCMALVWACQPAPNPDKAASAITEALENDNVDAARSKADAFFASGVSLDTLAVPRLCVLSVTLARLSESGEHSDDYMAQALQCYRVAMRRDSITATRCFDGMPADDFRHVNFLRQLRRQVDVREHGVTVDESDISVPSDSTAHGQ